MDPNRIRICNQAPPKPENEYVLYWMQAYRRFDRNLSLDFALEKAQEWNKPLIVYEGLRKDYPWNNKRIHKFILEGIWENDQRAKELGIQYWPFVETEENPATGLLKTISQNACLVVTDDFPCFIIPEQTERLAKKSNCQVVSIDGNSLYPLASYEKEASAARFLRIWTHKKFQNTLPDISLTRSKKEFSRLPNWEGKPPKEIGLPKSIEKCLTSIHFSNAVEPYEGKKGGRKEALRLLDEFIHTKLMRYLTDRSTPNPPSSIATSGLSPYLHFGFIGVEEIFFTILNSKLVNGFSPSYWSNQKAGDRENFFTKIPAVNHFFDELLTWRDIGYLFFWKEKGFRKDLSSLPSWVKENLKKHRSDTREYLYSKEQLREAKTHDELWNAAQIELLKTGTMHNYMRMLWGKKVIEWTKTYEEAFDILEEFNNLYAYDGRNPNSYTGILWCFGLFDRPWFPERNVFGNIRFMSSDSTKKKFKMKNYLDYIGKLSGSNQDLFS